MNYLRMVLDKWQSYQDMRMILRASEMAKERIRVLESEEAAVKKARGE